MLQRSKRSVETISELLTDCTTTTEFHLNDMYPILSDIRIETV